MKRAIGNTAGKHEENDQALKDQGFTVEHRGSFTVYRRPVSRDAVEASRLFSFKRRIGYRSPDIPGRGVSRVT